MGFDFGKMWNIMEKQSFFVFSGQIQPNWGTTARAAMENRDILHIMSYPTISDLGG